MSHIHDAPGQHDQTAGGYIIRLDQDEPKLMLHLHLSLNYLLHFGGHTELNETPWQAVLHEIREEAGYSPEQLELLQPMQRVKNLQGVDQHPLPVAHITHELKPGHYHTDIQYVFVAQQPPRLKLDSRESQDIRLFTREELLAIPKGQIPENVRQTGLFIFDVCLPEWDRLAVENLQL